MENLDPGDASRLAAKNPSDVETDFPGPWARELTCDERAICQ